MKNLFYLKTWLTIALFYSLWFDLTLKIRTSFYVNFIIYSGIIILIIYIQSIGSGISTYINVNLPIDLFQDNIYIAGNKAHLLLSPFFINKLEKFTKNNLLNISSITLISLMCFKFFLDINLLGFITLIISFLTSFFIFNKFQFSENSKIKILQTIVIYTILFILNFILILIIGWYFNIIPVALCSCVLNK